MKRVLFMRHGKSSWEYEVNDKDRPLKERGIRDAHRVAQELNSMGYVIDKAYSSPANRALHTAMICLRNLNFNLEEFKVKDALYDFSGQSVLAFLKGLDESISSVLIFGHNYAFTSLVNMLGDDYLENLPTAGLAIIELDEMAWKNIKKGTTKSIIIPKELR